MEDVSQFLGSWIALRLLNGSKWIGILKDVDWERSKVFMVKAHEMVGEADLRLLPFGSKVFSGGDIHDLTLLMPDSIPTQVSDKSDSCYLDKAGEGVPFSPHTPGQNRGEREDKQSPRCRKPDVLDAQKAWQAAAQALQPLNKSLVSAISAPVPTDGAVHHVSHVQSGSARTSMPICNLPAKAADSARPVDHKYSAFSAPQQLVPLNSGPQGPLQAPSTPSDQKLSPESKTACREFFAQLASLGQQPLPPSPQNLGSSAPSSLLTSFPPPIPPTPNIAAPPISTPTSMPPAAPATNFNQIAVLQQMQQAYQMQQLQQHLLAMQQQQQQPVPSAPVSPLAAMEALIKLHHQQQQQQQQQHMLPTFSSTAAAGRAAPQQLHEDLTPIRVSKQTAPHADHHGAKPPVSPLPMANSIPRTTDYRNPEQGFATRSSVHRQSRRRSVDVAPAGPGAVGRSPRHPTMSARQARQMICLDDFVDEQVEEDRQQLADGAGADTAASRMRHNEVVEEAVSWLMDMNLELEDSLKKLWEWVGLGFIGFATFEDFKQEFIVDSEEREQHHQQQWEKEPVRMGNRFSMGAERGSPRALNSPSARAAQGSAASPYARVRGGGAVRYKSECTPMSPRHVPMQLRPSVGGAQASPELVGDAMARLRLVSDNNATSFNSSSYSNNKTLLAGQRSLGSPFRSAIATHHANHHTSIMSMVVAEDQSPTRPLASNCSLGSSPMSTPTRRSVADKRVTGRNSKCNSPAMAKPSLIQMVDLTEVEATATHSVPRSRIIKANSVGGDCTLSLSVTCYFEMGLPLEIAQGLCECGVRTMGAQQKQLLQELQTLLKSSQDKADLQVTCLKTPSGPGTTAAVCAHLLHQVLLVSPYDANNPKSYPSDDASSADLHPLTLVLCPTRAEAEDMGDLARALAFQCAVPVYTAVGGTKMQQQRAACQQDDTGCMQYGLVIGTTGRVLDMFRRGRLDVTQVRALVLMESSALVGTSDFQPQAQTLMHQLVPHSLKQVIMLTPADLLPNMLNVYEQVLFSSPPAASLDASNAANSTSSHPSLLCRTPPLLGANPMRQLQLGGSTPNSRTTPTAVNGTVKLNPNAPIFGAAVCNWGKFCPALGDVAAGAAPGASLMEAQGEPSFTTLASLTSWQFPAMGADVSSQPPLVVLSLSHTGSPDSPLAVSLQVVVESATQLVAEDATEDGAGGTASAGATTTATATTHVSAAGDPTVHATDSATPAAAATEDTSAHAIEAPATDAAATSVLAAEGTTVHATEDATDSAAEDTTVLATAAAATTTVLAAEEGATDTADDTAVSATGATTTAAAAAPTTAAATTAITTGHATGHLLGCTGTGIGSSTFFSSSRPLKRSS